MHYFNKYDINLVYARVSIRLLDTRAGNDNKDIA